MFTRPDIGKQVVESIHDAYHVPVGRPTIPRDGFPPGNVPYPGTVVSLRGGKDGDGHTAVVTAVNFTKGKDGGHGTIKVLQQNFPYGHGGWGKITINKDWSGTEGTGSDPLTVVGWLELPYQTNWANGKSGWIISGDGSGWRVEQSQLTYDGNNGSVLVAPIKPPSNDYSVETRLRVSHYGGASVKILASTASAS